MPTMPISSNVQKPTNPHCLHSIKDLLIVRSKVVSKLLRFKLTVYTYSEVRQNFASVLDKARKVGKVLVKRKDGTIFIIKPITKNDSPLDVKGVDIKLSRNEIVDLLHKVRKIT